MKPLGLQIKDAQKHIRALKKTNPQLFFEYQDMVSAKAKLELAKDAYKEAKQRWKELGR